MSLMRQIRTNMTALIAIIGLLLISLVVAFYILRHERLRLPYDDLYTVQVELPTGQALTPGQGQSATVAGVRVGEVSKVELRDGRALVSMAIETQKLRHSDVKTDAHVVVRPRTPLNDMTMEIDPGSPRAPKLASDAVLGVANSTPTVNLDEILSSLDSDTRSWLVTLLDATGRGVKNQGGALREFYKAGAPTAKDTQRVTTAINARRRELSHAVHNLSLLSDALGKEDKSVAKLIGGGNQTFAAFADETSALQSALRLLPPTLDTGRAALAALTPLANEAGPAFTALLPSTRALPAALKGSDPLFKRGAPAVRDITDMTRRTVPIVRDLQPALANIQKAAPGLESILSVLRYAANEFSYVPNNGDHGYLFWTSWFAHNLNSFQGNQDGNGSFWRGTTAISCSSLLNQPVLVALLGPLISQVQSACPATPTR
jgi:phospholipid/cholesterol/gamma-HCH transport system substrate-binding protein